jgi:diguanylate cyclase (GGDEF)-like protein/PAS domain S-box-containing protein
MAEGVVVLAGDGGVQSCNAAAERILGAELCRDFPLLGGASDSYWLREDGSPLLPADLPPQLTLATGQAVDRMILGLRQAAAGELWLSMSSRPLPHDNGESYAAVVSFVDVTAMRKAGLDGRMAQAIFENVGQPVVVTDADARIVMINPAAAAVTGFSAEEALGERPSLWRSDRHDKAFYERMWQAVIENGQWIGEIWNRNKAGEAFPVLLSVTAIRDPSSLATRYVGIYTDITERKRSEAEMWRRANFDPLTGLPNRMLFYERLDRSLSRAARESARLAVLFIDLDGFKPVNDQYGHQAGDVVLSALAGRMQQKLRESDTVARLGGDEFVVLLQNVGSDEEVLRVGEGLLAAVEAPVEFEERLIYLSCSIGIAFFPENAADREALMLCADAAMYRAKVAGKGRLCIGDPRLL